MPSAFEPASLCQWRMDGDGVHRETVLWEPVDKPYELVDQATPKQLSKWLVDRIRTSLPAPAAMRNLTVNIPGEARNDSFDEIERLNDPDECILRQNSDGNRIDAVLQSGRCRSRTTPRS